MFVLFQENGEIKMNETSLSIDFCQMLSMKTSHPLFNMQSFDIYENQKMPTWSQKKQTLRYFLYQRYFSFVYRLVNNV